MAKKQILFECQACGHQSAKWLGKCPNCGTWEEVIELSQKEIDVLKEIASDPSST